jgi:hypothetical protein
MPPNIRLEPSRQLGLCHDVASARGSSGALGGLKNEDYGSIPGPLPRLVPHRARTVTSCSSNV